ncbi:TPA: Hha/YmoA family nucleoid-associated regulatory protein [Escherichia coli]
MNKLDYLLKFRRSSSLETLEKVFEHMRDNIESQEIVAFMSAYDHRKAEITVGKIFDKVPPSIWRLVN